MCGAEHPASPSEWRGPGLRTPSHPDTDPQVSTQPDPKPAPDPAPPRGGTALPRAQAAADRARRGTVTLANLVVGVVVRGQRDSVTGLASQFAYNAFIATIPLLIVVLSVVSLVLGDDAPRRIIETYKEQIPEAYKQALTDLLTEAVTSPNQAVLFLVLGTAGALYLVGNAIGALMVGLDRSRGVPHRSWFHTKVVGIKFAAIWSVLMVAVNGLLIVGQDLIDWADENWGLQNDAVLTLLNILFPAATLLLLVMVWVLYRYGPNASRRRLLTYLPGILVAAIGIIGFTQLFAVYVSNFTAFTVYGTLIGVVVYLTLLWGIGVALLGGAEVNEEIIAMRRGRPTVTPRRASVDQD